MQRTALTVLLLAFVAFGQQHQPSLSIRVTPPSGSTFAPGQRFDVRIETNAASSASPKQITIKVNGRDRTSEILGHPAFMPNDQGGGITGRNWSIGTPGKYELEAFVTAVDGTTNSAKSLIEVEEIVPERKRARNVILFIGDGMGLAQRTAARIFSCGVRSGRSQCWLNIDRMESYGVVATASLDAIVTDSSPGAGAYATGNKSANNWHGVFPDNTDVGLTQNVVETRPEVWPRVLDNPRVENIAEILQRTRGMVTGVVTTVSVTDSTPAAFSSHAIRYAQASIAEQYLQSGHTVIMGAGTRFFLPAKDPRLGNIPSSRPDSRDLIADFTKAGYTFVSNASELETAKRPRKLLGLFHPRDMASRYDRIHAQADAHSKQALGSFPDQPSLETMTRHAIDVLSEDPRGFFLMVEAGSIDRQYHMLDPGRAVFETIELDKSVGVALEWARQHNNDTLVVVTADHETSGLTIAGFWENGKIVYTGFPTYSDKDHDGFPDTLQIERPLILDNERTNPVSQNPPVIPSAQFYEVPRNLKDLNPGSPLGQSLPDPPSANHPGTDIVISASGPGAELFSGAMDNTTGFFNILRALGYKGR